MTRRIKIFDTTLRDGEQSPGCSMSLEEKIEIAKQLEKLNVDAIEAGFAISSKGDFESVSNIAKTIKNSVVTSLARALEKDIDVAYEAVKHAVSPRIHTFISTSPVHMQHKLRMSPEQVIEKTAAMVAYAKKYVSDVQFSAEDATRTEPEFLAQIVQTAIKSGATVVNIPDTVGFTTPNEMYDLIKFLKENVPNIDKAEIAVHCHNDLGMAVANSLAAVQAGANQIECTLNGLGERAGNAALEEIVMALHTRKPYFDVDCGINTTQIYRSSRLVYNIIGMTPPINKAIVGANSFAHESGIHQHGVLAEKSTYEIMTPESIGLKTNNMVLGKHSGRHAFEDRLIELGYEFSQEEINTHFEKFKELCDKKKQVSNKDIIAIITNKIIYKPGTYELESFDVHASNNNTATCVVTLKADNKLIKEVAIGDGPINAAYNAIDKIVNISEHSLENYSINSVSDGTDALGEVIVKIRSNNKSYVGRGLSTDIIESSILAYLNGINKIIENQ
ncbi:MAG: 2-isopropylmalate synthase [Clostridiales bacterium]|jgi:2-isopropylmalate synthase|nr:2-isopropylmalate synthase [Clostridiales bacterium]